MGAKAAKVMTGGQFRALMKQPKPGAYLFYGEEGFLKRRELESLREKLCPDESLSAFNHFVITRDSYTPDSLISAVLAPAMMTDLKLVEIYCLPFAEYRKKEDSDAIETALKAAASSDDTLLVVYTTPENFDSGDTKAPSAWMKLISKYAVPVEFAHEPTQRLVLWVQRHFTSEKLIAEPDECIYLIDTVGHDMTTLEGEIGKLRCYLKSKERDKLQKADIDLICPHNKEVGAFDFADAILATDNDKAFWALGDMKQKGVAPQVILGSVTKIYMDLLSLKLYADSGVTSDEAAKRLGIHPFVAKLRMEKAKAADRRALEGIIELCATADAAMKSSAADEFILLERLIVQASQLRKRRVF